MNFAPFDEKVFLNTCVQTGRFSVLKSTFRGERFSYATPILRIIGYIVHKFMNIFALRYKSFIYV